jgi:U3 small nucleolar RNA-associated protein 12
LASASLIESIKAHDKAIWSLQVRPDKKGLVTGSADTNVKFWDFDIVEEKPYGEDGVDYIIIIYNFNKSYYLFFITMLP